MKATSEELAKYKDRAEQYDALANFLLRFNALADLLRFAPLDPQVRSVAGQWAIEAHELAKRWANETQGGL